MFCLDSCRLCWMIDIWLIKECFNVFEWAITSVSGGNHRHFYYASKALNLEVSSLTLPHLQSEQSLQSLRKMEKIGTNENVKATCLQSWSLGKERGAQTRLTWDQKSFERKNQTPMRLAAYSVTVTHLTKMQIAQICVAFCQSFAVTIWLGICFTSVDIPRKRIFTCYSEYSSWRPVLTPRFGNGLGHRLGMTKASKAVPTRFRHRSAVPTRWLSEVSTPKNPNPHPQSANAPFRNEMNILSCIQIIWQINANHLAQHLNLQDMDSPTVRTCSDMLVGLKKIRTCKTHASTLCRPGWVVRQGQSATVWQKGSATAPPNISRLHHSLSSTCDRRQLPNFRELASEVQ